MSTSAYTTSESEIVAKMDDPLQAIDSEIAKIRETIKEFQNKRRLLAASLLSSDHVRRQIEESAERPGPSAVKLASTRKQVTSLMNDANKHRNTNYHRLAFSTTLFPWKDPNPYNELPNLLGLRIDVCERNGSFVKPYYVLLQREKQPSALRQAKRSASLTFSIHRHTIPPFIPMEKLAHRYLPQTRPSRRHDGAEDEIDAAKAKAGTRKQDLNAFARHLRKELAAWYARRDSISWLQERLGVTDVPDRNQAMSQRTNAAQLVSLAATSLESRYVRLEWTDGRVGRFKISNIGLVERVVVIGENGRDKRTELILMGGDGRVESLVDRLSTA